MPGTLAQVLEFCSQELDRFELIVVDDGSADNTEAVVGEFKDVRYLRNEVNRGKGETVKRGMLAAELDTVLFSDVDLSTPIEEALVLMKSIDEGADVVIGSRRFDGEKQVQRSWPRRLMAWGWRTLVHLLVLDGIHDTQCGFKCFRGETAQDLFPRLTLDGFAFDVELLHLARKLGLPYSEVGVDWYYRSQSKVRPIQDSLVMVLDLIKIRWRHRNPV